MPLPFQNPTMPSSLAILTKEGTIPSYELVINPLFCCDPMCCTCVRGWPTKRNEGSREQEREREREREILAHTITSFFFCFFFLLLLLLPFVIFLSSPMGLWQSLHKPQLLLQTTNSLQSVCSASSLVCGCGVCAVAVNSYRAWPS